LDLTVKTYLILAIVSLVVGSSFFFAVALPPSENPPKGPIEIGVGPLPEASINKTEVYVDVPDRTIDVHVTLRFNETKKYFIYAMFPYEIVNAQAYAVYNSRQYPDSTSTIGNFSCSFANAPDGSSITNATLELNASFPFLFIGPDLKDELTIGVFVRLRNSLTAIDYPLEASRTLVLTFFGDVGGMGSSQMYAFKEPLSQITIMQPFIVFIRLPPATYLSESQPSPIEYYVKGEKRWLMFSLNFLEGRYAQTLFCTFVNHTIQALKQIFVFLGGVFIAISSSSTLQILRRYLEKKEGESTKEKRKGKPKTLVRKQSLDTKRLIKIVDTQFEKRLWFIRIKNVWLIAPLAINILLFIYLGYLLYFVTATIMSNSQFLPVENSFSLMIALVASLIAFGNLGMSMTKAFSLEKRYEEFVDYNYKKLKNQVSGIDGPILKALVTMKSKQLEFDLKGFPDQDFLDRTRLYRSLYE